MNKLNLFNSKSLLLCGIILGGVMLPALSANGQCVANHYLKRHGSSAYQASGLNPYTGRYVFSVYFTPLQNQLYSDVVPGCATCDVAVKPEVDLDIVSDVNGQVDKGSNDPKPETKNSSGASTASRNDINSGLAVPGESTPVDATTQATSVNWTKRKQNLID